MRCYRKIETRCVIPSVILMAALLGTLSPAQTSDPWLQQQQLSDCIVHWKAVQLSVNEISVTANSIETQRNEQAKMDEIDKYILMLNEGPGSYERHYSAFCDGTMFKFMERQLQEWVNKPKAVGGSWIRLDEIDRFTSAALSIYVLNSDTTPTVQLKFACSGGKWVPGTPAYYPSTTIRTGVAYGRVKTFLWYRIDQGKNVKEAFDLNDTAKGITISISDLIKFLKASRVTVMYEDSTPSPVVATFLPSGIDSESLKATCHISIR